MTWFKFTKAFTFKPTPVTTQIFKKDDVVNVPKACADAAIKAGAGEPLAGQTEKPAKKAPAK